MAQTDRPWSHEIHDDAVVWDITDWTDPTEAELREVTRELRTVAGKDHVTACITEMKDGVVLDPETMAYIEQNNQLYADLGIERVAWVSDGIQGLALKSKVEDVPGVAVEAFDDVDEAVSWATE